MIKRIPKFPFCKDLESYLIFGGFSEIEKINKLKPRFSIIIPCYNSTEFLKETLCSLAVQVFMDFEVILVDDGSSDESFELASNLFQQYSLSGEVVRKSTALKKGVSSTRNYGVSKAKGDWIVFLDSDDIFHPSKLHCVHQYLKNNAEAKALCHSHIEFAHSENITYHTQDVILQARKITLPELITGNTIGTSTVVLSRQLMLEVGEFDINLNGVEDYYQWLKILCVTPFHRLDAKLTYYRTEHSSLMGRRRLSHYVHQSHMLYSVFKKNDLLLPYSHDFYTTLFHKTMIYYINNAQKEYGCWDVLKGVGKMIKLGHYKPAFRIITLRLRARILTRTIKFIDLLKK
ncbi:MAG: glycosyltransferase family 2 protein [Gammaproteobacteria bacterium]|nr:glycosyltransferase family 2 protein [Gammaproteobacteria bacterium]